MTHNSLDTFDPSLDLVLERVVDVPPHLIWKAWTEPEHLVKWFTPKPWTTVDCEIDLRPGGLFRTVMRSPEGQNHENIGCYLDLVVNSRLVWTDMLGPGYRPRSGGLNESTNCGFHRLPSVRASRPGHAIYGAPAASECRRSSAARGHGIP